MTNEKSTVINKLTFTDFAEDAEYVKELKAPLEIEVIPFGSVHAEALQFAFAVEEAEPVTVAESLCG